MAASLEMETTKTMKVAIYVLMTEYLLCPAKMGGEATSNNVFCIDGKRTSSLEQTANVDRACEQGR